MTFSLTNSPPPKCENVNTCLKGMNKCIPFVYWKNGDASECYTLLDKVMSRNQRHIGVRERHLMFKGPMQLNYNVFVYTHFCAMVKFQFA